LAECFICKESLVERGLDNAELVLKEAQKVSKNRLFEVLHQAEKVLTF